MDCGRWTLSQTEYVFNPGNGVTMPTTHNNLGNNAKQERAATPCRGGVSFCCVSSSHNQAPLVLSIILHVLPEFRTSEMNTQVAASGAGRASMIHTGLGLKCSRYVFSRFRGKLHQAKSGNGGKRGGVSYMLRHPSGEWGVGSHPNPCMILLTTSRE